MVSHHGRWQGITGGGFDHGNQNRGEELSKTLSTRASSRELQGFLLPADAQTLVVRFTNDGLEQHFVCDSRCIPLLVRQPALTGDWPSRSYSCQEAGTLETLYRTDDLGPMQQLDDGGGVGKTKHKPATCQIQGTNTSHTGIGREPIWRWDVGMKVPVVSTILPQIYQVTVQGLTKCRWC